MQRRMKKLGRRFAKPDAIITVLGLRFPAIVKRFLDATDGSGYDAKAPLNAQLAAEKETPANHRTNCHYADFRGNRVPAGLASGRKRSG